MILNLDHVLDLHADFGGRLIVRPKNAATTELAVSRDRVRALKVKLGL